MSHGTEDLRNLVLVGHAGVGKTSLAEALLHAAGAIPARGSVDKGSTLCDFDPLEHELKHSLDTAICHFEHQGALVNLIDTPGYPDLLGRALAVLPAAETAAVVVGAPSGIELGTRRVMEAAARIDLDRILVVNKIDAPDVSLEALVAQLQEAFGSQCLPINLPAEGGKKVVDCFFAAKGPDTDFGDVASAHRAIVEQVVEVDEELLNRYLEGDEAIGADQLHDPFEKALREGHLIPICFVSAESGAGVDLLLDLIARLMPNPTEANPPGFVKGEGDDATPVAVVPDPNLHAVGHVLKVRVDPYVGRVGAIRVHQGTIRPGSSLFVGDQRKPFKVAHLYRLQGKDTVEIQTAVAGEICAVAKVDDLVFDAVVHDSHDEDHHHVVPAPTVPGMVGVAVETTRRGDEQKLAEALAKLQAEDPSLRVEHVAATNETVLYGMGELHLRVLLERMKKQYNVELATRPPTVPYRETITKAAEGHHRHRKQTGGAGQFGEVFLRVEPLPRGSGFEFQSKVVGGAIPAALISAVEKGVREVLDRGAIAGFPIQDLRVTVHDGKTHPVDSKEVAFIAAGRKAFLDAIDKAAPIVLEPIMNVFVSAPAESTGSVTGDLSAMRGRVVHQEMSSGNQITIECQVPLAEIADYHQKLKAHTAGEGTYSMELSHYEPVPPKQQQDLVSAHGQKRASGE